MLSPAPQRFPCSTIVLGLRIVAFATSFEASAFAQQPSASTTNTRGTPPSRPSVGAEEPSGTTYDWGPLFGHVEIGPTAVSLGPDITLNLPASYRYIDRQGSKTVLENEGYLSDVLGMVLPDSEEEAWEILLKYEEIGFIKDDETIDANNLLPQLREAQSGPNDERRKYGFEGTKILGWSVSPHYDRSLHQLVWGVKLGPLGGELPRDPTVNYEARVLGRKGFVSINLVTHESEFATYKVHADEILKGTSFNSGARYGDYKSGDKESKYGLTGGIRQSGLVGVSQKRGWKGVVLLAGLAIIGIGKLLGLKKTGSGAP